MTIYHKFLLTFGIIVPLAISHAAHAADNSGKFRLKPGASTNLCLDCHIPFKEKLKKAFVHTPVRKDCTGCHNPHASSHGRLLGASIATICSTCHQSLVPAGAKSVHKVVAQGECMKCHDPHSAEYKNSLAKQGNALCFECHKKMGETAAKLKFKHQPVEKSCLTCHSPHASAKEDFLLKDKVNALCIGCHKTDRPVFARKHMNYPVGTSHCTGCHDPHGSDVAGILYNNVHKPVTSRMCNQCHDDPSSATPLKVKKEGAELCRGCHSEMYNKTFDKNRVHWPLLDKRGCLSCHNPHASTQKGLLLEPMKSLCGKCHADTIQRQEKSFAKHEPIRAGECTACHDPHAADNVFLARKANVVDLCAECHDWMKHSSHPLGEKFRDPRNKNLSVQCLSCHRSHGTEFKTLMPFATTTELCIQCHEQFRR